MGIFSKYLIAYRGIKHGFRYDFFRDGESVPTGYLAMGDNTHGAAVIKYKDAFSLYSSSPFGLFIAEGSTHRILDDNNLEVYRVICGKPRYCTITNRFSETDSDEESFDITALYTRDGFDFFTSSGQIGRIYKRNASGTAFQDKYESIYDVYVDEEHLGDIGTMSILSYPALNITQIPFHS